MTGRDLMIGDLVYRPACYDVVTEIRKDGIIGSDSLRGLIPFSEIEPIPLTDEIVAENFSQYSESCEPNFSKDYLITDIGATITYDVVTRLIGLPVRNIAGDWEFYSITEIRYVHQLQHALRLCGIEKEINL